MKRTRAFFFAVALAGCGGEVIHFDLAAPDGGGPDQNLAFYRCESYCLRPSDCAVGFPDGEICPGGFLCSTLFQCAADGGARD